MSSPSEMLQTIHQMVSGLPEQLSATLGSFQQPELGNFTTIDPPDLGTVQDTGTADELGTSSNFPEFASPEAAFPSFPEFASPQLAEQDFPVQQSMPMGSLAAVESPEFSSLPGFSGSASSMPGSNEFSQEGQTVELLREIAAGLKSSPSQGGFQRSGGPVQISGQRVYVGGDGDDFAQASPSVDRGGDAGTGGAGGYGFGSRYGNRSFLSGGGPRKSEQDHYLGK